MSWHTSVANRAPQAFNLVAQRDSKVNLAVAEDSYHVATLAARDSETMKTITVLTLLFLPSTLVTVNFPLTLFLRSLFRTVLLRAAYGLLIDI